MNLGSAMYRPLALWNGSGANMDVTVARRTRRWARGWVSKRRRDGKVPQRGRDGCWCAKWPFLPSSHRVDEACTRLVARNLMRAGPYTLEDHRPASHEILGPSAQTDGTIDAIFNANDACLLHERAE